MLDPPPDRRARQSTPSAHWGAPVEHFWPDDDDWDDPVAGSSSGSRSGSPTARDRRTSGFVYPVRRWPRRILLTANLMVALLLIGAVSVYGYFNWRISQISRVLIPHITSSAAPGAPMTILVVGSDSRAGNKGNDASQFGSSSAVAGQRSDTIMVVHVDPASTTATVMSIPRDLWVPIPGKNYSQRINTTFDTGPDLLVQTIEQNLGITIDHYVEVNFQSFRDVVNAVGGVKEYFPTPARDAYSLLNVPNPGCYTMNGDMALTFVRARHYEYKVNGRWVYEAESDLARIRRQQAFIKKMLAKAQGSGLTNPIALNNIIGGVTKNLTLDSGFNQSLLLSLAKRFRNLSPSSLPSATLPTTPANVGGADVLLLQQPQAQQAIADFMGRHQPSTSSTDQTPTSTAGVPPASVRVAVLNGTGRPGEAAKAGNDLARQGFAVTGTRSATNFNYTSSVVRYQPGNEAKAQLVASAVLGATQLQSDATISGGDVELITGTSYQGISVVSRTGASTPSGSAGTATTATTAPSAPPAYELPGSPAGFVPPPC